LLFATPLFAYGMLLFSHALTAFALFGSWLFLFTERRPVLAGVLMGIAVLSEHTSAAVAIFFPICAAISSRRDLVRFVAGGPPYLTPALPFIVFLIAFAEISFGAAVLMGMSIAAVVIVSLVFPFVPPNAFPLPWGSLAWPILRDGLVAPNLLHFIARPIAVAVPFILVIAAALIGLPRRFGS